MGRGEQMEHEEIVRLIGRGEENDCGGVLEGSELRGEVVREAPCVEIFAEESGVVTEKDGHVGEAGRCEEAVEACVVADLVNEVEHGGGLIVVVQRGLLVELVR